MVRLSESLELWFSLCSNAESNYEKKANQLISILDKLSNLCTKNAEKDLWMNSLKGQLDSYQFSFRDINLERDEEK